MKTINRYGGKNVGIKRDGQTEREREYKPFLCGIKTINRYGGKNVGIERDGQT